MSENHSPSPRPPSDDVESMMAEARSIDDLLSGGSTKIEGFTATRGPDPSILLVLCRALENEAPAGLQSLTREHLIRVHAFLAGLKGDVEQLLARAPPLQT